jgi:hypothetical protein
MIERPEGIARSFWRVAFGDLGKLIALNLLFLVVVLPSGVLYALVLTAGGGAWAFVSALVASLPVGGAVGASVFCVAQLLQRESLSVWSDFTRKFVETWRSLALPGVFIAGFIFSQLYFWSMVFSGADVSVWMAVLLLLSLCVVLMIAPYVFLQAAHLDATVTRTLVNAAVLASGNGWRTFLGMVCASFTWFAIALFLPVSLVLVPGVVLIGFSFTFLASLVFIWPAVDAQFGISDELRARQAKGVRHVIPLFDPPE